jgi:hypothetical protein
MKTFFKKFLLTLILITIFNPNVFTNSSLPSTCQLEDYSDAGILLRP